MADPQLSICIPVWKDLDLLDRLLTSILEKTNGVKYEIVIAQSETPEITNYASDATGALHRIVKSGVEVVVHECEPRGHNFAVDEALRVARGTEYLMFVDVDVVVSEGWWSGLQRIFDSETKAGVIGPIGYPRWDQFLLSMHGLPERILDVDLIDSLEMKTYRDRRTPEWFSLPVNESEVPLRDLQRQWGSWKHEDLSRWDYCVVEDRPVLIRKSIEDKINVLLMRDLWGICNSPVIRDGEWEVKYFEPGSIETMTCSTETKSLSGSWKQLLRIARKRYNGDVVRIHQPKFETVVTPEHLLYGVDGVFHQASQGFLTECIIDITLPNNRSGIKWDITHLNNHIIKHIPRSFDEVQLTALGSIFGAYCSEGGCFKGRRGDLRYEVYFTNTDVEWLKGIEAEMNIAFPGFKGGYSNGGLRDRGKPCYKLYYISKELYYFFLELGGGKCREKRIPYFIFDSPNEVKNAFLKRFWEGDGLKLGKRYTITTTSPYLVGGISLLLLSQKRKFTIYSYKSRDPRRRQWRIKEVSYRRSLSKPNLKYEYYDGYVYDLTVVDNHNFSDAMGFPILHNCFEGFLVMRRGCYSDIGGYHGANDETGISRVARVKGWKVICANRVYFWHYHGDVFDRSDYYGRAAQRRGGRWETGMK